MRFLWNIWCYLAGHRMTVLANNLDSIFYCRFKCDRCGWSETQLDAAMSGGPGMAYEVFHDEVDWGEDK